VDIWFPDGYDTANLQGAKALREVLAGKDDRHTTLLQQIAQIWHRFDCSSADTLFPCHSRRMRKEEAA